MTSGTSTFCGTSGTLQVTTGTFEPGPSSQQENDPNSSMETLSMTTQQMFFAVGAFGMFPISSLAVVDGEVAKDPFSPQPEGRSYRAHTDCTKVIARTCLRIAFACKNYYELTLPRYWNHLHQFQTPDSRPTQNNPYTNLSPN